jgi:hypothetical protein
VDFGGFKLSSETLEEFRFDLTQEVLWEGVTLESDDECLVCNDHETVKTLGPFEVSMCLDTSIRTGEPPMFMVLIVALWPRKSNVKWV